MCGDKSVIALLAIVLANLFYWVGAGLLWGMVHSQVSEFFIFEGAFNAATW